MALIRWLVLSVDMWGHVSADCCPSYECDCCDETQSEPGEWSHDDDACECHEEENDRHKVGTIEAEETVEDDHLVWLLFEGGFLTDKGRKVAKVEDYSDGYELDVVDDKGRKLFVLQKEEVES